MQHRPKWAGRKAHILKPKLRPDLEDIKNKMQKWLAVTSFLYHASFFSFSEQLDDFSLPCLCTLQTNYFVIIKYVAILLSPFFLL